MTLRQSDISIIVTSHAEGILLHKTLLSVVRSIELLNKSVSTEIIIHVDTPTPETARYLEQAKIHFPTITVFSNTFGGPGQSRDFCIEKSSGRYITFIDGDDLMSKTWLRDAYKTLESKEYSSCIAHSEMTIEFGGFDSIVQKYGHIDKHTDALLNVWSARWNSVIFAPASLLKRIGYPHNLPGYGYEDWLISCSFITGNVRNVLIPQTVMFVRRKESDSVWDSMRADSLVLPAHPLLSFDEVRKIPLSNEFLPPGKRADGARSLVSNVFKDDRLSPIKRVLKGSAFDPYARKMYSKIQSMMNRSGQKAFELPRWLLDEWRDIHEIDRKIFPTDEILSNSKIYHSITELHYRIGGAYRKAVGYTKHSSYDYILFVPWLVSGGADSFAINYANAIARYNPEKRVLVLATMLGGANSVWQDKLDKRVDFIPLNDIFSEYSLDGEHQNRILEQLVENSHATHLHILNSIAGYDFVRRHKKYLSATNKQIIATSFSESTDSTGRVFGFSHTHVPYVYEQCALITTDNSIVRDMWINLYGFDEKNILLHRPMIDLANIKESTHEDAVKPDTNKVKVLWAARLAPEKLPELVPKIAKLLPDIQIDMYGTADPGYSTDFTNSLPANVSYMGPFNGFFSLPLEGYSAYLYTSLFDGLPNALIEASAARLPIVASAAGGIPDFINEHTGILIKDISLPESYAKALKSILASDDLSNDLTNNAYAQLSSGYEPDSHYQAICEMLKKLNY